MQLLDYQDPPVSEFRAATSQDARSAMVAELGNLLRTVPEEDRRVALLYCTVLYCTALYRRARMADLDGFSALFDKFVTQPGSSVDWDKIEKLPANSVRTKNICSIIEKYYLLFTDSAAR